MNLSSKKVMIAGAGLAGSTIARVLAESGVKVEILEKRNFIIIFLRSRIYQKAMKTLKC